jgi:hypothetical protein
LKVTIEKSTMTPCQSEVHSRKTLLLHCGRAFLRCVLHLRAYRELLSV